MHECPECAGVFLDQNAIALVVEDESNARADAVAVALPRAPIPRAADAIHSSCPSCAALMNRKFFAAGTGIVVDVCRDHGAFLDAGELPALVEFVQSGNLARAAARKTADRIPLHKQPETFAKTLAMARLERRPRTAGTPLTAGSALIELLFALFA